MTSNIQDLASLTLETFIYHNAVNICGFWVEVTFLPAMRVEKSQHYLLAAADSGIDMWAGYTETHC